MYPIYLEEGMKNIYFQCCKLFERIIHNKIQPIIDEILPIEQAGFYEKRLSCEQVLTLTSFVEAGYKKFLKTGAVLIYLSSAYDTVWGEGLLLKLSRVVRFTKTIGLINSMLINRRMTVHLDQKKNRQKKMNNGLPQASVLASLLFNLYVNDMPKTKFNKFQYADDSALAYQDKNISNFKETLEEDLMTLRLYFKK